MSDLAVLLKEAMLDHKEMHEKDRAYLVLNLNKILKSQTIPGLIVDARETEEGLDIDITVEKDVEIMKPIHMCFGVTHKSGDQYLNINIETKENSSAYVLAHCIFPKAESVKHIMDAKVHVGKNAKFKYFEKHVHNKDNGIYVRPTTEIVVEEGGYFRSDFELLKGRVGDLEIKYTAYIYKDGIFEVDARLDANKNDRVLIDEEAHLIGENSRALMLSRAASRDEAHVEVKSTMIAEGNRSVGHMDCQEILKGKGTVNAIPIIRVKNDTAHVTHESALGSVNSKQLETLMCKGLTEDESTEIIIKGMLRE
jgi:uncharacterized protein